MADDEDEDPADRAVVPRVVDQQQVVRGADLGGPAPAPTAEVFAAWLDGLRR